MGQRQDLFKRITLNKFREYKHERLSKSELESSSLFDNVRDIYKKIGGQYYDLPIRYGTWDISTTDFIIELDEERHFNRYRLATLTSDIYTSNSLFLTNNYKTYCKQFENECLKPAGWGKNWKNASTEKMFIKSGPERDLSGNGSSRWRQRAYYDFLKDITSKIKGIPVIRVSIYDTYCDRTINDLLTRNESKILKDFIDNIIKHRC